jgi:hypothetical protein
MVDRREFLAGVLSTSGLVAVKGNERVIPLAECKKLADAGKLNMTVTLTDEEIQRVTRQVTENLMRQLKFQRLPR